MKRFFLAALAAGLAGCPTEVAPVTPLDICPTTVVDAFEGPAPIGVDVLLVVSTRQSMCETQPFVAASLDTMTEKLYAYRDRFDFRVAVTSTDMDCAASTGAPTMGRRSTGPGPALPASCRSSTPATCTQDSDCGDPDQWRCETPTDAACLMWSNGAIASRCVRTCDNNADCASHFGDPEFDCVTGPEGPGCLKPLDSAGCPTTLPAVLTNDLLEDLSCIGSLGVSSSCEGEEQGMAAALAVLESGDPQFRRRDAYVLLVFITTSDDQSVNAQGQPLSISEAVARLKSSADDPAKVIVAVLGGDSTDADPAVREQERNAFAGAQADSCPGSPYICSGVGGVAEWSRRYQELAEGFGSAGLFSNICDGITIGWILDNVFAQGETGPYRVCLTEGVSDESALHVTLVAADASETTLVAGEDFELRADVTCGSRAAVYLVDGPLSPRETLNISYPPKCL